MFFTLQFEIFKVTIHLSSANAFNFSQSKNLCSLILKFWWKDFKILCYKCLKKKKHWAKLNLLREFKENVLLFAMFTYSYLESLQLSLYLVHHSSFFQPQSVPVPGQGGRGSIHSSDLYIVCSCLRNCKTKKNSQIFCLLIIDTSSL